MNNEYEIMENQSSDAERKRKAKSGVIVGHGFSPAHSAAYAMASRVNEIIPEQLGTNVVILDSSQADELMMGRDMSVSIGTLPDLEPRMNREQRRAEQKRTKKSNVKNKVR